MSFYMNLDAEAVRDVMPATNAGAKDPLITDYLAERQQWLANQFGGELPEDDKVIRGILRDLVAAAAMRKIATNDEERRNADGLRNDAMERLTSYENDAGKPAGRRKLLVSNITREPLWDALDFDGDCW